MKILLNDFPGQPFRVQLGGARLQVRGVVIPGCVGADSLVQHQDSLFDNLLPMGVQPFERMTEVRACRSGGG